MTEMSSAEPADAVAALFGHGVRTLARLTRHIESRQNQYCPSCTTLVFIRHGQSEYNKSVKEKGVDPLIRDAPLTQLGQEQACNAKEVLRLTLDRLGLRPGLILMSPLTRAIDTCQLVCPLTAYTEVPRVVWPELRERINGADDIGTPRDQLALKYPHLQLEQLDQVWWEVPPEMRETLSEGDDMFEAYQTHKERFKAHDRSLMAARVDSCVCRLQQCAQACIVIVAHNITIGELTTRLKLRDPNQRRRVAIIEKYGERYGEGIWMSNCEVQAHKIEWANISRSTDQSKI